MDNRTPERVAQRVIAWFPLAVLLFFAHIKFYVSPHWYAWLMLEDGHIENATCLLYLAACATAGALAYTYYKRRERSLGSLALLLSLGFFFIAMEEISWGQRILQVKTPEVLLQYNTQQELNAHNLLGGGALHSVYIVVGFYGAFAALLLPKAVKKRLGSAGRSLIIDSSLSLYFLPTFLFYFYWEALRGIEHSFLGAGLVDGRLVSSRDQELMELLLAAGFFLHAALQKYRQHVGARAVPPAAVLAFAADLGIEEVWHDC